MEEVTRVIKVITYLQSFCSSSQCLLSFNLSNYLCNKVSMASSVLMKPCIAGISYCISVFSGCPQTNKREKKISPSGELAQNVSYNHKAFTFLPWWVICRCNLCSRKTAVTPEYCVLNWSHLTCGPRGFARMTKTILKWAFGDIFVTLGQVGKKGKNLYAVMSKYLYDNNVAMCLSCEENHN